MALNIPPFYTTVYTTQYQTMYLIVTNYYIRYPDGTRVLKRSVSRLLTPEEFAEMKKEEELVRKPGSSQAPREERELGVLV